METFDNEYWQEMLGKHGVDALRVDEIDDTTVFALVGEYSHFPCGDVCVWMWANGLKKFAYGLKEVAMRNILIAAEEEFDFELPDLPMQEYAKIVMEKAQYESRKVAIKNLIPFFEKYDLAVESEGFDFKQLCELVAEFDKLTFDLPIYSAIELFENVQSATERLKERVRFRTIDEDDLQEAFLEDC